MPQGPRGCIEQNLPLLQTCFFLVSTSRTTHIVVCHKKPRLNGDCDCIGACSGHTSATSVPAPTETNTRPTTSNPSSAAVSTSARNLRSLRNRVSENSQENTNTTATRHNCPLCEKTFTAVSSMERHLRQSHTKSVASATLPVAAPAVSTGTSNSSLPLPGPTSSAFNCPRCVWSGKNKSVLTRHMNKEHKKGN